MADNGTWCARDYCSPTDEQRPDTSPFAGTDMSTRRLIVAALLCGLAILVAFAVQVFTASR
jgi:hypothetical protein